MSKTIISKGGESSLPIVKPEKKQAIETFEHRAPVHVVYGGADRFKSDTPQKLGKIALKSLETYASNFVEFAAAMRIPGTEMLPSVLLAVAKLEKQITKNSDKAQTEDHSAWLAWTVYNRTIEKLKTEPVEDFRIDFEDGYGFREDEEEDAHAISASDELAGSFQKGSITAFSGFRIKSLAPDTARRSIRTLDLFLDNLLIKTKGALPGNFVVTLPKVSDRKEVKQLSGFLKKIEKKHGLRESSIKIEIMIETPPAIIDKKGKFAPRDLVDAAKGRCVSAHFGAYDYTAALGISAVHQDIHHPACDFARQIMLVSLSPLNIRLSDSVTTEIPVPIHKGEPLSEGQNRENRRAMRSAWHKHFENVTRSIADGFYQSWDLHPNQLVARYAAIYTFFLGSKDAQAARLKSFMEKATQATLTGNTFDDAASAQGLLNFFRRAVNCGALTEGEAAESTGIDGDALRSLTFMQLVERRRS